MRWLLLISLSGCDHFELEARISGSCVSAEGTARFAVAAP